MRTVKLIKRYGYREAWITNQFLVIPREWVESLEIELCKQARYYSDNHTTFEFEFDQHSGIYGLFSDQKYINGEVSVVFHDCNAYFGIGVNVCNW